MRTSMLPALLLPALLLAAPVEAQEPEAQSLTGAPLYRPALGSETRARLEADLAVAQAAYDRNPSDAEAIIWLGRRHAYLGHYQTAIETFGEGIDKHPADARMYRHRGHRYITVRRLDDAIRDLQHAADLSAGTPDEVEPDGAPNRFNIPVSTLQSNILPSGAGALPEARLRAGTACLAGSRRGVDQRRHARRERRLAVHDDAAAGHG